MIKKSELDFNNVLLTNEESDVDVVEGLGEHVQLADPVGVRF